MRNSCQEMIEVIQGYQAGGKLQAWSFPGVDGHDLGWVDITNPSWDFNRVAYRIKPEPPKPREWWIRPEKWRCLNEGGDVYILRDDLMQWMATCAKGSDAAVKSIFQMMIEKLATMRILPP